jgi:hypothetical protein
MLMNSSLLARVSCIIDAISIMTEHATGINLTDASSIHQVIESLVGFSKVVSESLADTQASICQLLRIANTQELEIARLRQLVESSGRPAIAVESKEDAAVVTLDDIMKDDPLGSTDQHDVLLAKMETRKKAIMYPGVAPTLEQLETYYGSDDVRNARDAARLSRVESKTQKELDVEAARNAILNAARQHKNASYGCDAR